MRLKSWLADIGIVIGLLLGVSVLQACQTDKLAEDHPARLVQPNEQAKAEIKQKVSEALNGATVNLGKNFLQESSDLIIEAQVRQTIDHPNPMGRSTAMPTRFQLVKAGETCYLVQKERNFRARLTQVNCQ